MKTARWCLALGILLLAFVVSAMHLSVAAERQEIAAPVDRPFAGEIQLSVDATDVVRRIVHVHERVSGLGADAVLWYPKWLPGTQAPEGPIDRLAAMLMNADGKPIR